jgi:hypothetical protein
VVGHEQFKYGFAVPANPLGVGAYNHTVSRKRRTRTEKPRRTGNFHRANPARTRELNPLVMA